MEGEKCRRKCIELDLPAYFKDFEILGSLLKWGCSGQPSLKTNAA
jgi:hypothetical protein